MSHDCDCDSCQETDSRWAYARKLNVAKAKDCPRGVHIPELWSTKPRPGEGMYRCPACQVWTDQHGVHRHVWNELTTDDEDGPRGCVCGTRESVKLQINAESTEIRSMSEANRKLLEVSAPVCSIHKRYQAKRKPRVNCEGCWRRYIHINCPLPSLDKLERALDGRGDPICGCGKSGCYMCTED